MAQKLVFALLCAAIAVASAREMLASKPALSIAQLPKGLQALNSRMAATAEPSKVAVSSIVPDEYKEDYEKEYYEPKYGKDKDEYYPKKEYYGKEKEGYGYGKVSVKLYEKFRSSLRPQPGNEHTFQFTSELTCQNPKKLDTEHEDGIIGFPLVSDRMKLVTVGVCEWTVTLVKEQKISEHASLKGNTNAVCTFTDEAARHCKYGGDVLEDGLTVSGQGLVYNFDNEQYGSKYGDVKIQKDGEPAAEGIDVYLALINGVVGRSKELKYDNGALQYFFGVPPTTAEKARDAMTSDEYKKGDPTGEYTLVFKH